MKKAALVAAALAMVLSLAACGNKDNNTVNDPANGAGTTQNGGTGTNSGTNANDDGTASNNGSTVGSGMGTGSDVGTGAGNGTGTGTGTGTTAGTGTGTGTTAGAGNNAATSRSAAGRSTVGNDLRRAADDVGDAVTGLVEDGRSAVARGTSTTSFQRMLDNARVHDVDGVLTDGENSRW